MNVSLTHVQVQIASLASEVRTLHANALTHEAADTFWLLVMGILVFFMQCGFGMLEAGAVASKSTESIMLKNIFDAALAGLLWWLVGFGLTNEGGSGWIGLTPIGNRTDSHFASYEMMKGGAQTSGPDWALVFFQYAHAKTRHLLRWR